MTGKLPGDTSGLSCDRRALDALDMVYGQGLTQKAVCKKYGLSRGAVAGFFNRDRKAHEQDETKHLDGTMPQYWYLDGLRKRQEW